MAASTSAGTEPTARAVGRGRHRVDRTAPQESEQAASAGLPGLGTLPATVDFGARFRVARQLPPTGGALQLLVLELPSLLSYRPLHDRPMEDFKLASKNLRIWRIPSSLRSGQGDEQAGRGAKRRPRHAGNAINIDGARPSYPGATRTPKSQRTVNFALDAKESVRHAHSFFQRDAKFTECFAAAHEMTRNANLVVQFHEQSTIE
jgi:hypothetical protein